METGEVISELNTLIAICKDGEQGYRTVATLLEPHRYHSLFEEYAEQRHRFATDLQEEVNRLGGIPGKEGDLAGTLHRRWIILKALITAREPGDILAECKAGEKAAVQVYEEVFQKDLPPEIQALVEHQYQAIKAARDRIQALETQITGPG